MREAAPGSHQGSPLPRIVQQRSEALPLDHFSPEPHITPEPGILAELAEVFADKSHVTQAGAGHVAEDPAPQLRGQDLCHDVVVRTHSSYVK